MRLTSYALWPDSVTILLYHISHWFFTSHGHSFICILLCHLLRDHNIVICTCPGNNGSRNPASSHNRSALAPSLNIFLLPQLLQFTTLSSHCIHHSLKTLHSWSTFVFSQSNCSAHPVKTQIFLLQPLQ